MLAALFVITAIHVIINALVFDKVIFASGLTHHWVVATAHRLYLLLVAVGFYEIRQHLSQVVLLSIVTHIVLLLVIGQGLVHQRLREVLVAIAATLTSCSAEIVLIMVLRIVVLLDI